jgi:protein-L-isoaspartate(D-aspartate) O-methyltransferase
VLLPPAQASDQRVREGFESLSANQSVASLHLLGMSSTDRPAAFLVQRKGSHYKVWHRLPQNVYWIPEARDRLACAPACRARWSAHPEPERVLERSPILRIVEPAIDGSPEELIRALEAEGIKDERIVTAFRTVRRARFVPEDYVRSAYEDRPIPIRHGQVTTQPSLVARMIAGLRLRGEERVLEIGTGLGFQTAVLAKLARQVTSIERFADLAEQARANLVAAGISNVAVIVGDGTLGLPDYAPFDAVVVTAAAPAVPSPLVEQLREGGRLVHPVGPGGGEVVMAFRKEGTQLVEEGTLTLASFVPLVAGEPSAGE